MAADAGPVGVDAAGSGRAVVVGAVAVGVVPDQVGETQVEAHLAGVDLPRRQGKMQLAADGVAHVHALGAVDLHGRCALALVRPQGDRGPRHAGGSAALHAGAVPEPPARRSEDGAPAGHAHARFLSRGASPLAPR